MKLITAAPRRRRPLALLLAILWSACAGEEPDTDLWSAAVQPEAYGLTVEQLTAAPVYDDEFYLLANPDLVRAGLDAEAARWHWVTAGFWEGRRAHPHFEALSYVALHEDLTKVFWPACQSDPSCVRAQGLAHWLASGQAERRATSPAGTRFTYADPTRPGDAVIGNERLAVFTSAEFAGAVDRLEVNGRNVVDDHGHGRLLQVAWQLDNRGECFNPTQAGSKCDEAIWASPPGAASPSWCDAATPPTTTRLEAFRAEAGVIGTQSLPAFWSSPGDPSPVCPSGTEPVSAPRTVHQRLNTSIRTNEFGDPGILSFTTEITLGLEPNAVALEAPTLYAPYDPSSPDPGDIDRVYRLDLSHSANPSLVPLPMSAMKATSDGFPVATKQEPLVLASEDGQTAIGMIAPDLGQVPATYRAIDFTRSTNPVASAPSLKLTVLFERGRTPPGKLLHRTYVVAGTLAQVEAGLRTVIAATGPPLAAALLDPLIFDPSTYCAENPDLAAHGCDPDLLRRHFSAYGLKEGRTASLHFDAHAYLCANPDLQHAFGPTNVVEATKHWFRWGRAEGRDGTPAVAACP